MEEESEEEEHEVRVTDQDYTPEREDYLKKELLADMEREIYVDNMILNYIGVFSFKELLWFIDRWCREKGYSKEIVNQKHKLTKDGKTSIVSYQMHRKFSPLHISVIDVTVCGIQMKDIEVELDGKTATLNEGSVEIIFNGFLMTHTKGRWESRPKFALIRRIIDKWVYKLERPSLAGTVVGDAQDLANQLRSIMYIYKHRLEAQKAMDKAEEKIAEEEKKEEEKKEDESKGEGKEKEEKED